MQTATSVYAFNHMPLFGEEAHRKQHMAENGMITVPRFRTPAAREEENNKDNVKIMAFAKDFLHSLVNLGTFSVQVGALKTILQDYVDDPELYLPHLGLNEYDTELVRNSVIGIYNAENHADIHEHYTNIQELAPSFARTLISDAQDYVAENTVSFSDLLNTGRQLFQNFTGIGHAPAPSGP